MGTGRGNIARGVLPIASFVLTFITAKWIARRIIPIDTGSSFAFRLPHPVLGWSLEPNASYTNRLPEASVKVTYNEGAGAIATTAEKSRAAKAHSDPRGLVHGGLFR